MWKLIDWNAELFRATYARRAVENGQEGWEIKTEYYADPTVEENKRELANNGPGWAGDYHKIASISPALAYGDSYIANAIREGDEKAMSKWLNDSDNRHWRTKEGTV